MLKNNVFAYKRKHCSTNDFFGPLTYSLQYLPLANKNTKISICVTFSVSCGCTSPARKTVKFYFLVHENLTKRKDWIDFRGVFKILSEIYDADFLQK